LLEWLYEGGIGECRAALTENDRIIEAQIEPETIGARAGAVMDARLRANRIVELEGGEQALIDRAPDPLTEGARLRVMVTRAALSEPGKPKRAKARAIAPETPLTPGESLLERITASDIPVTILTPHCEDRLEQSGWSELLEQAQSGIVPFANGALQISLTPAMTLIDIDGHGDPFETATGGMIAAAKSIRCFGIAGSIGIDVPTLNDKGLRSRVAAILTDTLERPYEATAINGFGFMQIIRPRLRASLLELMQYDRIGAAARGLARKAQRSGLTGALTIVAPPPVVAHLEAHDDWTRTLSEQLGGSVSLRSDPALSTHGGYVHAS
jgi:hypothetical protein